MRIKENFNLMSDACITHLAFAIAVVQEKKKAILKNNKFKVSKKYYIK